MWIFWTDSRFIFIIAKRTQNCYYSFGCDCNLQYRFVNFITTLQSILSTKNNLILMFYEKPLIIAVISAKAATPSEARKWKFIAHMWNVESTSGWMKSTKLHLGGYWILWIPNQLIYLWCRLIKKCLSLSKHRAICKNFFLKLVKVEGR